MWQPNSMRPYRNDCASPFLWPRKGVGSHYFFVALSIFPGRPTGFIVDCSPSRFAVCCCYAAAPDGTPRITLRLNAASSDSVCGSSTHACQFAGLATGPTSSGGPGRPSAVRPRLLQRHCAALRTSRALRVGFAHNPIARKRTKGVLLSRKCLPEHFLTRRARHEVFSIALSRFGPLHSLGF